MTDTQEQSTSAGEASLTALVSALTVVFLILFYLFA